MEDVPHPSRLAEAVDLAARVHAGQTRKGKDIPYLAHLLGVSGLVLSDGGDEDEAIAALLHDSIEDHPDKIDTEEIERRFGRRVRRLVESATDVPPGTPPGQKPPWRERKEYYLRGLRDAEPDALRLALADKLHNLRDLLADLDAADDPLAVWARFNAGPTDTTWYYTTVRDLLTERGVTGPMKGAFDSAVGDLESRTFRE